jgi:lipoprotein-releasing system permease protein
MIQTSYIFSELWGRRRRTWGNVSLVAFSIGLLLVVNILAESFQAAFHAPLDDIGADLTVQRAGDIPEKMEGPVLPCSVVPIRDEEVKQISRLAPVQSVAEALLMWDFEPDGYFSIMGLDPEASSGPALLRKTLVSGRFLEKGDRLKALADRSFSSSHEVSPGQSIEIHGTQYQVVGVVDTSRIGKLASAQVYVTLHDARSVAANSEGVRSLYDFGPKDSNILFVRAARDQVASVDKSIKQIMGAKVTVSTPSSFREMLGSVFSLTDRFAWMISLIALVGALKLVGRTAAANIGERKAEIGTMKAVGWTRRDIVTQVGAETFAQVLLGACLGIALGIIAAQLLSLVTISIPIPWEMTPRPHFLPGGADQLVRDVRLGVAISPLLLIAALAGSLLIGVTSAWAVIRPIANLKPAEALRHE